MMEQRPQLSPWRNFDTALSRPGRFATLGLILVLLLTSGCTGAKINAPALRAFNSEQDLAFVAKLPKGLEGPVTLQQAISFALAHNVETQLAEMQRAIQEEALTGKRLSMLPSLMAEYEVSGKSKSIPVRAEDPDTGATTLGPSISQDRTTQDVKVTLAWNILDFGVTYFKARQSLNRISIMEEQLRRAKQRLVLEVTKAYGEALVAGEAAGLSRGLLAKHDERLRTIRGAGTLGPDRRREGLKNEILTMEGMNELSRHETEYKTAKARLAQLLGLAPGADLTLVRLDTARLPAPIEETIQALEKEAILNRAELSEKDIQEHITADDARIALARLFPSPSVFLGFERNSNSFLTLNNWFSVGMNVSWNLFAIPQNLSDRKRSELGVDVVRMERMALATAILAQVHLSVLGYDEAVRQYLAKEDVAAKRQAYAQEMETALAQGQADPDLVLRERKAAFQARIECVRAYATLLTEREMVFNTLGRDPYQERGYAALQTPALAAGPDPAPAGQITASPALAQAPIQAPAMARPGRPGLAAMNAASPAPVTRPATTPVTSLAAQAPAQAQPSSLILPAQPSAQTVPPVIVPPVIIPAVAQYQPQPWPPAATTQAKPRTSVQPSLAYVEQAGRKALVLSGLAPGAQPTWFYLDGPDRLVIDIPGARYDGPAKIASSDPGIRQIRVGEHPGKVRVVLDLRTAKGVVPLVTPAVNGMNIFLDNSSGFQASTGTANPA